MTSSAGKKTVTRPFSVDARLFRELGERLVGKPHIALAELIKNSYDADATVVRLTFEADRIVVEDNGHGMSMSDFEQRWMRIGTGYKQDQRRSPRLHRTMTGSKGVGRLAVQMLARSTLIESVALRDATAAWKPSDDLQPHISASVDWDAAVGAGDITSFEIPIVETDRADEFPEGRPHGTRVVLTDLVHVWTAREFQALARELWTLQPPFAVDAEDPAAFRIKFDTKSKRIYDEFNDQMTAIMDIWDYRVLGELLDPTETDGTELHHLPRRLPSDEERDQRRDAVGDGGQDGTARRDKLLRIRIVESGGPEEEFDFVVTDCEIDRLRYDIRIFDLVGRQPQNVPVQEARAYLRDYGGVGVYDEGFRLPYYGPQDWLNMYRDQASRRSTSRLLPEQLKVERALHHLPAAGRVFGEVFVSTSHERNAWDVGTDDDTSAGGVQREDSTQVLTVQVTRDRLVDNAAFARLQVLVRAGIDLYAQRRAQRQAARRLVSRPAPKQAPSLNQLAQTVEQLRPELPKKLGSRLANLTDRAVREIKQIEESRRSHTTLLGSLATAGMTSIAYEHEISKQTADVRAVVEDLRHVRLTISGDGTALIDKAVESLERWIDRSSGLRSLFSPLMDEESRTEIDRYRAKPLVRELADHLAVVSRGIPVDTQGIPADLKLPEASLPSWYAIFQNLLINAFNALIEANEPKVAVHGHDGDRARLRIEDNGVGVDLEDAEVLWEPFERRVSLPRDLVELGLGGTGLGLTIVRMIGEEIGVEAAFVEPSAEYRTAVELTWEQP